MGLLLAASSLYIPGIVRKRKLEILFRATADAFQTKPPNAGGIAFDDYLSLYALFTRQQADKAILQGKQSEIQHRLFQNALRIGQQLKTDFRVDDTDVMRMGGLIYKIIKIDFKGEPGGNITIKRCFFSAYYSSQVCRLISSLDEGLLVGLAGGGKLSFSRRITEGNESCRAILETNRRLA
jgi:hypothetical protein